MQTQTLPPLVNRATLATGFARFVQEQAKDFTGYYKAFPQPNGHTLIGRLYGDWHQIPNDASILVELDDKTTVQGRFHRAALIQDAEFRLSRPGQPDSVTLVEFAQTAWQLVAGITGEAFHVTLD